MGVKAYILDTLAALSSEVWTRIGPAKDWTDTC